MIRQDTKAGRLVPETILAIVRNENSHLNNEAQTKRMSVQKNWEIQLSDVKTALFFSSSGFGERLQEVRHRDRMSTRVATDEKREEKRENRTSLMTTQIRGQKRERRCKRVIGDGEQNYRYAINLL